MKVTPDGTTTISYHPTKETTALSAIQKVEIVLPVHSGFPKTETWAKLLTLFLVVLPLKTLLVFWFVATWFPQLGLTYWSLILPVWLAGILFQPLGFRGRFIPKNRLWKTRTTTHDLDTSEVTRVDELTELAEPVESTKL